MDTHPAPGELVTKLTEIVTDYHRRMSSEQSGSFGVSEKIAVDARTQIMTIIGAREFREFVEANLKAILDPNVCAQNIVSNNLDEGQWGRSAWFVRGFNWQGSNISLGCIPKASPSPRLGLYVTSNGEKIYVNSATIDVAVGPNYDVLFNEKFLYASALDHCNGCLAGRDRSLRPLGDAIIQFGAGALEDASQLDTLANNNEHEYTARYLLGLPASLTDILQKAIGK